VLLPEQIVGEAGVTVTIKDGTTVTVTFTVSLQPPALVPITVYTAVAAGLAVTELPVVALNPAAGDHVYVDAPLAVNKVLPPVQRVGEDGVTDTAGRGLTIIVIVDVSLQAPLLPITVYVVVAVGVAVGLGHVVQVNDVAGLHA
jgi:hypothetical protein